MGPFRSDFKFRKRIFDVVTSIPVLVEMQVFGDSFSLYCVTMHLPAKSLQLNLVKTLTQQGWPAPGGWRVCG